MRAFRKIYATLLILCLAGIAMAQDVIVKTDQTTVLSKVLEISSTEIKYKKWGNLDGPTYSISRSEVLSINYENGEVEIFTGTNRPQPSTYPQPSQIQNVGYMEAFTGFPAGLKANGRTLTNEEVQSLVDYQNYQLYLKGKRKINAGDVLCFIGGVVIGGGVGAMLQANNKPGQMEFCAIVAAIGVVIVIPGIPLSVTGSKNLKQVAETYNLTQNKLYSLNISPTMMQCDLPQSQGNCGLGVNISMNF